MMNIKVNDDKIIKVIVMIKVDAPASQRLRFKFVTPLTMMRPSEISDFIVDEL